MSAPRPIRPLADHVINQIAAGEVIERPVSIIKELLENSLDAGAKTIAIEVVEGGIEKILIRDDGHGIAGDALPLAVLRHHTSKLVRAEELSEIGSLGFRGEALASIAAVAEFSLISRVAEQSHGWRIDLDPKRTSNRAVPHPHPAGTSVEVRRLFAELPARRRFLKRPRTEFLHIQQLVRRAGFCYPDVGFRLVHDGRQNLRLAAATYSDPGERRWRSLFGTEFIEHARSFDVEIDGVRIHGWLGELGFSRQNTDLQTIAVNRRIVRDRNISRAIRMAYQGSIDDARQPAFAIHVELGAEAVDVNVHPGKAEVRFHDPRTIHDIVFAAAREALLGNDSAARVAMQDYPTQNSRTAPPAIAEHRMPSHDARSTAKYAQAPLLSRDSGLLDIVEERFVLFRKGQDVSVLDAHAAIHELSVARLAGGICAAKPLLIPEVIDGVWDERKQDLLRSFGVEVAQLGDERIALRALPVIVSHVEPVVFFTQLWRSMDDSNEPGSAIAQAAAKAFRAPPLLAERRDWFSHLIAQLAEHDIDCASFTGILSGSSLANVINATVDKG